MAKLIIHINFKGDAWEAKKINIFLNYKLTCGQKDCSKIIKI